MRLSWLKYHFGQIGIDFEAEEGVALVLAGHELQYPEFPQIVPTTQNKGFATIHAGDHYPSFLQLPFVSVK